MAQVCDNCHVFKTFGTKCFYYWERKRACSQFKTDAEDVPNYKSVET
ncbi:hypothetical protein HY490_04630 [Candidatus Woesearchaeota archaeon]|nr:hypothetical protein [Candidatus Woesearchaeota archaeon]